MTPQPTSLLKATWGSSSFLLDGAAAGVASTSALLGASGAADAAGLLVSVGAS